MEGNIHKKEHIQGKTNTVEDTYNKEYIEGGINGRGYIKDEIHKKRYTEVDTHRMRGDTHEEKYIR